MIDTYGENCIEEVLSFFKNSRIFATNDMSLENRRAIEREMTKKDDLDNGYNPYQTTTEPGAYYSYEPIYVNGSIEDEIRWIVVNTKDGEKYREIFGIPLNMPYFLHELNHAFTMQNPVYERKDNIIHSKHGMYTEILQITNDKTETIDSSDIILEEIINELYTQRQLTKLSGKESYNEVDIGLRKINHVSSTYNPVLIMLAERFEDLIGKDKLFNYRKNNDMSIKDEFNSLASMSSIKEKYFPDMDAWDYFSSKCFEIFTLSNNKIKYIDNIEEYGNIQRKLIFEAFAPLCAYREIKQGDMNIERYEEIIAENSR